MNKKGIELHETKYNRKFKIVSNELDVNDINIIMALDKFYPDTVIDVEDITTEIPFSLSEEELNRPARTIPKLKNLLSESENMKTKKNSL